jgi:voltage-gated potassium channel
MTVITVTTVGFQEVKPLSENGRLFTSVLILTSLGTSAYALSAITTYFIAGEFKQRSKAVRTMKQIMGLKNHVIVCGYGRVGEMVVNQLQEQRIELVVVESDELKVRQLSENPHLLVVKGNATTDENLIKAGVQRAKALVSTLPDDADNLYVVLTAREMSSQLSIVSRASKSVSVPKLRFAGANHVIMPDRVGGAFMAEVISKSDTAEFIDQLRLDQMGDNRLTEVSLDKAHLPAESITLDDFMKQGGVEVNVIGLKNEFGNFLANPSKDLIVNKKCKLFVLGSLQQIEDLLAFVHQDSEV